MKTGIMLCLGVLVESSAILPFSTLYAAPPEVAREVGGRQRGSGFLDRTEEILTAFAAKQGKVFELAPGVSDAFGRVEVKIPEPTQSNLLSLTLRPYSVRAENFALIAHDEKNQPTRVNALAPSTVRGVVIGDQGSRVAGALVDGRLTLSIRMGDGRHYFVEPIASVIEGAGPSEHLIYDSTDRIDLGVHCGADADADGMLRDNGEFDNGDGGIAGDGGVSGTPCDAQLVVDCDYRYFLLTGATIDSVATRVEALVNIVNDQYESEVGIRHTLTGIVVRNSVASDPYVSNLLCASPDLLPEVQALWSNVQGAPFPGISRDMVHLFTGRVDPTSGTVGCAYIGDVCFGGSDYVAHGASRAAFTPNTAWITDLLAHEMGHNWGAIHCTCETPPSTMNPNLLAANTFLNSPSIGEIMAWRGGHQSCFDCTGLSIDGCGDPAAGSAWNGHPGRFAYQSSCCARICVDDPYCCNNAWDAICATSARALCAGCGQPGTGSAFVARLNPGCSDAACCSVICVRDPFCCDSWWDGLCVTQSEVLCRSGLTCDDARLLVPSMSESYNFSTAADFVPSFESECGINDVYSTWLRYRPLCSGMTTMQICTEFAEGQVNLAAFDACPGEEIGCSASPTGCGFGNGGVQLTFAALAGEEYKIRVSANNGGYVAGTLSVACSGVCGTGGSCGTATGTPGCANASCCVNVCSVDPFCCETSWDIACVNEAQMMCFTAGDFQLDGDVDAADLGILLNNWGLPGVTDLDGDGVTNAADLATVLSNWG